MNDINLIEPLHTPECRARHTGLWLADGKWLQSAVSMVRAGTWPILAAEEVRDKRGDKLYTMTNDGIAIVSVSGHMMKGDSKFGGANTVRTRQAIRQAARSDDIRGILLNIDSPGGTVDGTDALANDIKSASGRKPVAAHISDEGASAAYWIASQTPRITAEPMARVGSIGTFAVIEDTSEMAEQMGVKVHLISSGGIKGAGADGVPVPDELLENVQAIVDAVTKRFKAAIADGRGMESSAVDDVATGEVFMADQAKRLGLVDNVATFDDALGMLRSDIATQDARARRDRAQGQRIRRSRL